jgi:hypothetical protein
MNETPPMEDVKNATMQTQVVVVKVMKDSDETNADADAGLTFECLIRLTAHTIENALRRHRSCIMCATGSRKETSRVYRAGTVSVDVYPFGHL